MANVLVKHGFGKRSCRCKFTILAWVAFVAGWNGAAYAQVGNAGAAKVPDQPPEFAEFYKLPLPNGETLRNRLFEGLKGGLDTLAAKDPDDLILKLNCDLAKQAR